jgi:CHAT domain-containing protein
VALDFEASRETAASPDLGQYRIVHFATHGLLNNEHPELSGIVLSLVDQQGKPQNGFFRLYDVYNMNLSAKLVVLSACQTALGKQVRGEGLMGLTRGFMYAGSARVMASLWRVEDEATAEMMKKFYEGMIKDGQRPAAALKSAQVWLQRQKRWRAPYYWAGFILQGEWR